MGEQCYIKVNPPEGAPFQIDLTSGTLSMGRSSKNDIIVSDILASRFHAEIFKSGTQFIVRDLGSKNGTILNGNLLKNESILNKGDEILIGKWSIIFCAELSETSSSMDVEEEKIPYKPDTQDLHTTIVDAPMFIDELRKDKSGEMLSGRVASAVYEFGLELVSIQSIDEVYNKSISRLLDFTGSDRGFIYFIDETSENLVQKAAVMRVPGEKGLKAISKTVSNLVVNEKKSIMAFDALMDDRLKEGESVIGQRIRSIMCAPLWSEEKILGMIYIDSQTKPNLFNEDDLQLMTVFTNMVAIKIENLKLFEVALQKRAMDKELAAAIEIQKNLLPSSPPELEGYDIGALNIACKGVGGDYYDFLTDRDEGIGIVVADVAGKGLSASLLMSNLQATLKAISSTWDKCISLLSQSINKTICDNIVSNRFISFFIGCLHPDTGEIQYCNAGHNPPVLLKKNGEESRLKEGGPVLGILPDGQFNLGSGNLESGDILVLYSDGVTEAENPLEEEFGEARLIASVRKHAEKSSHEIIESVEEDIEKFSAGRPQMDDITLIVVKRL
jgi:serine phosphatase RsbU (regulator of sigma subunit)/pSer/pThr/pTyr-binding forkhead associated (FHA) protein